MAEHDRCFWSLVYSGHEDGGALEPVVPGGCVEWSGNEAVFENSAHDFPQRIIYKLSGTDSLAARIEGTMNGKASGMDFLYVRGKCK